MIKNEINFEALLDLVKSLNFEVQKIQKKPFKVNLKKIHHQSQKLIIMSMKSLMIL